MNAILEALRLQDRLAGLLDSTIGVGKVLLVYLIVRTLVHRTVAAVLTRASREETADHRTARLRTLDDAAIDGIGLAARDAVFLCAGRAAFGEQAHEHQDGKRRTGEHRYPRCGIGGLNQPTNTAFQGYIWDAPASSVKASRCGRGFGMPAAHSIARNSLTRL